jgi:demethylsterigmatocystin 6-O-methyltransferase
MDSIITQIKSLAQDADEASRRKILDGLRDLALSLETPQDTMQRISYLVCRKVALKIHSWPVNTASSTCPRSSRTRLKHLQNPRRKWSSAHFRWPGRPDKCSTKSFMWDFYSPTKRSWWTVGQNLKHIANLEIIARVLRYLASVGTIKETGDNEFTDNNITRSLSDEGIASAIYHK